MSINKFNVGDKVRVRKDLCVNKSYGDYKFTQIMENLKGKEYQIVGKYSNSSGEYYELKNICFRWTDEMLEPEFKPSNIRIIQNHNTIIAKMENETGMAICNKKDNFDVKEGIRIAVCRLLKIDPFETKKIEEFSTEELLKEIERRVK